MDAQRKKDLAVGFIGSLADMDPQALQALIQREAGEALSAFFTVYASKVMEEGAGPAGPTASTLMMLGYLVRAMEEQAPPEGGNGAGGGEGLA